MLHIKHLSHQNQKIIILLQIFIGGWSNQKSAIRRDHTRPDKANVDTPDILSNEEFRGFWVTYLGGVIAVGRENEVGTFVSRSSACARKKNKNTGYILYVRAFCYNHNYLSSHYQNKRFKQ